MASDSESSDSFDDLLKGRDPKERQRKRSKDLQAAQLESCAGESKAEKKKRKKEKKARETRKDSVRSEDDETADVVMSASSSDGCLEAVEEVQQVKKRKKRRAAAAPVSGNWQALVKTMPTTGKRLREDEATGMNGKKQKKQVLDSLPAPLTDETRVTKYLALDCEMVGVGPEGIESMLAQVVVVNSFGNIVYNKYVAPMEAVVDYRTHVSGIRKEHLEGAPRFEDVQREVAELTKDRIIVGHSLESDLKALLLSHPRKLIRDTAKYPPLLRRMPNGRKSRPHALKWLTKTHLNVAIQGGEHDPSVDARAALLLYKKFKKEWEASVTRMEKRRGKRTRRYEREQATEAGAEADVYED